MDTSFVHEHGRPFQVLEAGTGHGSLTLYLAKAIHAANSNLDVPLKDVQHSMTGENNDSTSRPAVIHTTDVSAVHSEHARKIVSDYRRGMYARNVTFHVGSVAGFLEQQRQSEASNKPFLDAVVLDLPAVQHEIATVADAIVTNGTLAMFCPQVTQVVEALRLARSQRLPLFLDQVVELSSLTTGGRQWDLRLVRPRKHSSQAIKEEEIAQNDDDETSLNSSSEPSNELVESIPAQGRLQEDLQAICRPKYGDMITAGGFLAIWKKMNR